MKIDKTVLRRLHQKAVLFLRSRLSGWRMQLLRSNIPDSRFNSVLRVPFPERGDFRPYLKSLLCQRFPLRVEEREDLVSNLRQQFPEDEDRTVSEADRICRHLFDLLGSGETSLGSRIDWHRDFINGHSWDESVFFTHLRPAPDPGGYDIKVPWELSRCQHYITLGKAYWYTGDEKYAREMIEEIEDWIARNPPCFGVNWGCTMEVSIRVANWIVGFYFIVDSPSLTKDFVTAFLKSLVFHGRFIINNLEVYPGSLVSNHAIANYTGLMYLGVLFPGLKESRRWRRTARQGLRKEMQRQVYHDGVDFESSTSYHALVLECFLSATLLSVMGDNNFTGENYREIARRYFNEDYLQKLSRMVEFILYSLKPNRLMPQIGDNDSGRLYRFSHRPPLDYRHLMDLGAVFFQEPRFKVRKYGYSPIALLLLGIPGYHIWNRLTELAPPRSRSRAYPDAGIYIMRHDDDYMIVSAGPNGQNGNGGHCHNDKLSFELSRGGRDIIVDPGSYIYTGDYEMRNIFRGTSSHNTVMIDGKEQNRFIRGNLFRLENDAMVKFHRWESTAAHDFFDAEHHGYRHLKRPVIHRRKIFFNKEEPYWIIKDLINGPGYHEFVCSFHFAPGLEVRIDGRIVVALSYAQVPLLVLSLLGGKDMDISIEDGWVSGHYGRKVDNKVIYVRGKFHDAIDFGFLLSGPDREKRIKQLIDDAQARYLKI